MKDLAILKVVSNALSELYPDAAIILPNEPIAAETTATSVFFEVATSGRTWTRETEGSTVSTAVGSVIINGRENAGVGELDEIADAIIAYFAPRNPSIRNGFSYADADSKALAYVTETERSESGIHNGRFKITVFITFVIYEE